MKITWDDPDRRYYQRGLDHGVLYPREYPLAAERSKNYIYNPRATVNTNLWSAYGVGTVLSRTIDGGSPAFLMTKSSLNPSLGQRTAAGMTPVPAGQQVTISAWVKNPIGSAVTSVSLIARDDTNGDSGALVSLTAGATGPHTIPADGVWRQIFATGSVKAARNLEAIYVTKNGSIPAGETFLAKDIMVNDGVLIDFFDGDTPEDLYGYEWVGTPYASESVSRSIAGRCFPWNGLMSVDEGGVGSSELLYRDGVVYLADAEPGDFVGVIQAIMYPDAFSDCVGIPRAADGFYVDNQKPKPFHLSYRTLIGSGSRGDMFGYQLHLLYNCMATIGQRKRNTIGADTTPVDFTFDLACTPVKLPGYRPTAHYIIDNRNLSADTIAAIEDILYGTDNTVGRMPTPTELFDILNFGDAITVVVHPDETYTVTASEENLIELSPDSFLMRNINGADLGDGTYVISDGGNTDVIIE